MSGEKDSWVERAKLAEQAERYEDMAKVGNVPLAGPGYKCA